MERYAMIPLIVYDLLVNVGCPLGPEMTCSHMLTIQVYLTVLFVLPLLGEDLVHIIVWRKLTLSGLYAFNSSQQTRGNRRLKLVAVRTLIGCICTLTSSVV